MDRSSGTQTTARSPARVVLSMCAEGTQCCFVHMCFCATFDPNILFTLTPPPALHLHRGDTNRHLTHKCNFPVVCCARNVMFLVHTRSGHAFRCRRFQRK